jgi:3-phosphoshikimate 1-carboxyvinyltransferase
MHDVRSAISSDALRALGATSITSARGFLLAIRSNTGTARSRRIAYGRGDVSSQFTSALLMALPSVAARRAHAITLDIDGELISKPYVAITTSLMRRFGVAVDQDGWRSFTVPAGARYQSPGSIRSKGTRRRRPTSCGRVLGGGPVRVTGVGRHSIQGDVAFADVLARMGATIDRGDDWIEAASGPRGLSGIDIDCVAIPDAAMTLAVVALFAHGPTTLTGIASWRVKETDRIAAMAPSCAARCEGRCERRSDDHLPPERFRPATIATTTSPDCDVLRAGGLGGVTVRIVDPDCVRKTFPGYFASFRAITS